MKLFVERIIHYELVYCTRKNKIGSFNSFMILKFSHAECFYYRQLSYTESFFNEKFLFNKNFVKLTEKRTAITHLELLGFSFFPPTRGIRLKIIRSDVATSV